MNYSFQINLALVNFNSPEDLWSLSSLFEDCYLSNFIDDAVYSKYTYFIKNNEKIIGFVYLMKYKNANIYNLEYGIKEDEFNIDYIYTSLTIIRDKIKGYHATSEIKDAIILTKILKDSKYNEIAKQFGNIFYTDKYYYYYEVNPNCENLEKDKIKTLKFLNFGK